MVVDEERMVEKVPQMVFMYLPPQMLNFFPSYVISTILKANGALTGVAQAWHYHWPGLSQ